MHIPKYSLLSLYVVTSICIFWDILVFESCEENSIFMSLDSSVKNTLKDIQQPDNISPEVLKCSESKVESETI